MLCNTWKSFFAKIVDSCPTTCVSFCFATSASLEPSSQFFSQILWLNTCFTCACRQRGKNGVSPTSAPDRLICWQFSFSEEELWLGNLLRESVSREEELIRNNTCSRQSRQCMAIYMWPSTVFPLDCHKSLEFESRKWADRRKKLRCWHRSCISRGSTVCDVEERHWDTHLWVPAGQVELWCCLRSARGKTNWICSPLQSAQKG